MDTSIIASDCDRSTGRAGWVGGMRGIWCRCTDALSGITSG